MKIALIVISCFVFLVVPQFGWAGDCSPLQISFIPSLQLVPAEKDICGLRLNLPVGDNDNISGLDLGFVGGTKNSYNGIMLNLFGNFSVGSIKGIELAGLINLNISGPILMTEGGSGAKGIELAGCLNLNLGDIDGVQIAGLANTGGGEVRGIQIAGLFNGGGDVRGIQLAGLLNFAESVRGVQIGLINVTPKLSGLQIGLVNYIGESPVPILPIINLKF